MSSCSCVHGKIKTQILGQPNPETKGKKGLEYILRPIQNLVSLLPDHFGIGVKMTSKTIFLPFVLLPQILGFGFSV